MKVIFVLAAIVAICVLASANTAGREFYLHSNDAVASHERIRVAIYLQQSNKPALERRFWEVSNPKHENYGKYMSVAELASLVGASDVAVEQVTAYLVSHGVAAEDIRLASTRDYLSVYMPVAVAEKVFQVELAAYEHHSTGRRIVRSEYKHKLPQHIAQHIDLVSGISEFPPSVKGRRVPNASMHVNNEDKKNTHNVHHAQRLSATAAHKSRDAVTPGVPQILVPRGGDRNVTVTFNLICTDGSVGNTDLCASHPPAVTNIVMTATSAKAQYNQHESPVCNDKGCSISTAVENYEPLTNITLMQQFADGTSGAAASTAYMVVPSPMVTTRTLSSLYNIPEHMYVTHPNATQCVVEFEQQYYDQKDLVLFLEEMGLESDVDVTIIGPNDQSNPGVEALLDIEYIMGVAPNSPTTFWSIEANSTTEVDDILQWAVAMGQTENPPLVNSLSYGMGEGNVDKYLGQGYLLRSDAEFQKLAVRGITVIIACGDTGAGDLGGPPMGFDQCERMHPDWPSQSPYVTAVGSTYITPFNEPVCYLPQSQGGIDCQGQPLGEVTTSVDFGMRWTTGGGFSDITPRPDYQNDMVLDYFKSTANFPPMSWFTPTGRAYPDVATVGHNLWVAAFGSFIPVDGTSASAPIFAGIVTLLNDARLNAGKQPLGFLNPLLYQIAKENPQAFNDIVVGRNACGALETSPVCCDYGYEAAPGFDAVSGLGTPNFPELLRSVLAAP